MSSFIERIPSTKLIDSLRYSGYNNYSAICDIVDNSVDAKATEIRINIKLNDNGIEEIEIVDNGHGMDQETVIEALRLGSETEKNRQEDLGRFGLGLTTASISMGKRLKVISCKDDKWSYGIQDIEHQKRTREWQYDGGVASDRDRNYARSRMGHSKSGTVVIISEVDRIDHKTPRVFIAHLTQAVGQIFRYFIQSGVKIFINKKLVEEVDPLYLSEEETKIYYEDIFKVGEQDVKIRLVAISSSHKVNQTTQGFYVVRNKREIAEGEDLDLFTKNNELNRFRGEIIFNAELDEVMGVNFTKKQIKPQDSIVSELKQILLPRITEIRKKLIEERRVSNLDDLNNKPAEEKVKEVAPHLLMPEAPAERRNSPENKGTSSPQESGRTRDPKKIRESMASKIEWIQEHNGEEGEYLKFSRGPRTVRVHYNVDHPFHSEFQMKRKEDQIIINTINYLSASMGTAYLRQMNSENIDILDDYFYEFSRNLRIFMKP